jgi:hypothetical protein
MQDDYFKMLVHSRLSYRQNVDSTGGSGIIIRAVPLGFEAGADLVNKVAILVDKPACCDAARDATCDDRDFKSLTSLICAFGAWRKSCCGHGHFRDNHHSFWYQSCLHSTV